MTDQLIGETILPATPEIEQQPQYESSHRIRSFMAKSAIVACGALGAATALFTQQPSAERTIGPVTLDAEVTYGQEIEFLGLPAADSKYGIGMSIDAKIPDLDEIPDISRRLAPIALQTASKDNQETVLELVQKEYSPEINDMKNELIKESLMWLSVGALAGSFLSAKTLEKLGQNRQNWKFIASASLMGVLLVGGAEYQSLGKVDTESATARLSRELQEPFDKYLLTSTSNMLVNLNSINKETTKQISRLVTISGALAKPVEPPTNNTQTWVVYSDSHVLPTVPETIQAIAQSANADAILDEGDYGNTGNEYEMDVLDGLSFEGTDFIGFNDIRSCNKWDRVLYECKERGELLPHGTISGNHDPRAIEELFDEFGMTNLDRANSFNGVSILALADACFVDSDGCRGGDAKKVNQAYAQEYLTQLQASGEPLPEIGFFASYDAADIFMGEISTLIVGGKHEFSHKTIEESEVYYVPTVGQAFPRGAKTAGALILSLQQDGTLVGCNNVSWQTLRASAPTIEAC